MNYLITGGNGFLGKYIKKQISKSHNILTLGKRKNNDIVFDFKNDEDFSVNDIDIVIHCAGTAHGKFYPITNDNIYYLTNFLGTKKITKNINSNELKIKQFIFISSVSVYGLHEGNLINENQNPNPADAYSNSKLLAENHLTKWGFENKIPILILRLPLVVGKNPPGNLKKMIQFFKSGIYISIGNNPARKSAVLAADVALFISKLDYYSNGVYNLTDGYHPKIKEIEYILFKIFKTKILINIPKNIIKIIFLFGTFLNFPFMNKKTFKKLTCDLTFDDSLARENIGWKSRKVLDYFDVT